MADLITYEQLPNNYLGGLELDKDTNSSKNQATVYVASSSWWAQITISKNVGSWGRSFTLSAAYWNGSTWVDAWSDRHSWNQFEGGTWSYKYYHNSTLGSTSNDVASAVLWELYFDHMELYDKDMWVYAGGIGCMPEDTYNNLYRGKLIYSCGRLASHSIYNAGDGGRARDRALSLFTQTTNSPTLISASNEDKLVAYKFS